MRSGALNPAAIGWSRRPLQRVNLRGVRARRKRWEHWALMNEELLFLVTLVDLGPLSVTIVGSCDLRTRVWEERVRPARIDFPDSVHERDIVAGDVVLLTRGDETILRTHRGTVTIDRRDRDTLNVLVPFARGFAFTSKQVGFPARGTLDGRPFEGLATLDHGRGVWPWRTKWNWACAADARAAFSVGARWTDGSGTNENGYFLNGKLFPIAEDLRFAFDRKHPDVPVGISGPDVDLMFVPIARKRTHLELGLIAGDLDFRVGRFVGTLAGTPIRNLLGWCEAFDARW